MRLFKISFFLFGFLSGPAIAVTEVDCYKFAGCIGGSGGPGGQVSGNPSFGNQIRINPSAVPTEKGLGIEAIYYSGDADLSLVQGFGRVGAALSPANSEETFFGPPGFETDEDLYDRKVTQEKYPSQKYSLAGAIQLYKKGGGLKARRLQLGLMARYNRLTKKLNPGAGLNGVLGPLSFGASIYNDESQLEDNRLLLSQRTIYRYQVTNTSVGLSLGSLLLDYSVLEARGREDQEVSRVYLTTASLMVKRLILTYSLRKEDSSRSHFNFQTQDLEQKRVKEDFFAGVQVYANRSLMFGLLYNYYMLREYSLSGTWFF